ncbi:hypothetical protein GQ53DRAFT_746170 [Thozetella sp. PMI_491]|nr:hypothetical protein GQ53DRAFT_746170 [Thozetella sp. PMI_491]
MHAALVLLTALASRLGAAQSDSIVAHLDLFTQARCPGEPSDSLSISSEDLDSCFTFDNSWKSIDIPRSLAASPVSIPTL